MGAVATADSDWLRRRRLWKFPIMGTGEDEIDCKRCSIIMSAATSFSGARGRITSAYFLVYGKIKTRYINSFRNLIINGGTNIPEDRTARKQA